MALNIKPYWFLQHHYCHQLNLPADAACLYHPCRLVCSCWLVLFRFMSGWIICQKYPHFLEIIFPCDLCIFKYLLALDYNSIDLLITSFRYLRLGFFNRVSIIKDALMIWFVVNSFLCIKMMVFQVFVLFVILEIVFKLLQYFVREFIRIFLFYLFQLCVVALISFQLLNRVGQFLFGENLYSSFLKTFDDLGIVLII